MHELFVPNLFQKESEFSLVVHTLNKLGRISEAISENERMKAKKESEQINERMLERCEHNEFTKEEFAALYASGSKELMEMFLYEWNPKQGKDANGREIINEIVACRYKNNDTLTIDIIPTPLKDNLFEKIFEGFGIIAQKIKNGDIAVRGIFLESWLLGSVFEEKARSMLGENIEFLETDAESQDVARVQHQALFYNNRSLEKYLRTGKKPEVRAVYLTRDEFIKRFT